MEHKEGWPNSGLEWERSVASESHKEVASGLAENYSRGLPGKEAAWAKCMTVHGTLKEWLHTQVNLTPPFHQHLEPRVSHTQH